MLYVTIKKCDYGRYSEHDKNFLSENIGKSFATTRHNINYYRLSNGVLLHLYDS